MKNYYKSQYPQSLYLNKIKDLFLLGCSTNDLSLVAPHYLLVKESLEFGLRTATYNDSNDVFLFLFNYLKNSIKYKNTIEYIYVISINHTNYTILKILLDNMHIFEDDFNFSRVIINTVNNKFFHSSNKEIIETKLELVDFLLNNDTILKSVLYNNYIKDIPIHIIDFLLNKFQCKNINDLIYIQKML